MSPNAQISRRGLLRRLAAGAALGGASGRRPLGASQSAAGMQDLERQVRSRTPREALFVHLGKDLLATIASRDGALLGFPPGHRMVSADGGTTWGAREPVRDADGRPLGDLFRGLVRLKSGALGGFYGGDGEGKSQYTAVTFFVRSEDEGRTWSRPVRIVEPNNNAWMYHNGATVTTSGRIVVSVFNLLGKTSIPERGRARFRNRVATIGHHGYEEYFTYCHVYYSDDEGKSWRPNEGKGVWGSGGELFVTLDQSAGGNYGCEEPVVAEVEPDHLLMLMRTPLGRFYQSWSDDDGKSWSLPEPTSLASAYAPAALARIPGSRDLLVVWNQASQNEIEMGLQRCRISSAVSQDGGATWQHGPNVISRRQNEVTRLEPPPIRLYRALEQAGRLPPDDLEVLYPVMAFWRDRCVVSYGCMERSFWTMDEADRNFTKQGIQTDVCVGFPISWFYTRG
jgi:hypothetical protein